MREARRCARSLVPLAVFCGGVLLVAGCGSGPKLVKVQGKVYLNDQPRCRW